MLELEVNLVKSNTLAPSTMVSNYKNLGLSYVDIKG